MQKDVISFVPAHVSGFFSPHYNGTILENTGSTGSGFNLSFGTLTKALEAEEDSIQLIPCSSGDPVVSWWVLHKLRQLYPGQKPVALKQEIQYPQGSGFGSSGAGAYGAALALIRFWDLPLGIDDGAKIAHEAEVLHKTGLGTVAGQWQGGMEIRLAPGAPSREKLSSIAYPEKTEALFVLFGSLSTSKKISDPDFLQRVKIKGDRCLKSLLQKPNMSHFLTLSQDFAKSLDLGSEEVKRTIEFFSTLEMTSSQLMFGDGVFTLAPKEKIKAIEPKLLAFLTSLSKKGKVLKSIISPQGGRYLEH